jgi:hypothetical protein
MATVEYLLDQLSSSWRIRHHPSAIPVRSPPPSLRIDSGSVALGFGEPGGRGSPREPDGQKHSPQLGLPPPIENRKSLGLWESSCAGGFRQATGRYPMLGCTKGIRENRMSQAAKKLVATQAARSAATRIPSRCRGSG